MLRACFGANHFNNRILAALPKVEMDRLGPQLSRVTLKQHDTLMGAREKIKNAYFLEDGIVSVVTNLRDGNTVEVVCWAGTVWSDCLP